MESAGPNLAKTSVFPLALVVVGAVLVVVVGAGSEQRELFRPVLVFVLIAVLSLGV